MKPSHEIKLRRDDYEISGFEGCIVQSKENRIESAWQAALQFPRETSLESS